jgi:hypothetical protein
MANNTEDWLPVKPELFAEWLENFNAKLPGTLATKYGITAGELAQLQKDNDWTQYWVQAKLQTEMQKKQINDYFDTITKEPDEPQPAEPTLNLPEGTPAPVPPGVRRRVRDIAAKIKGQKAIYNQADGELLGIVGTTATRPDSPKPTFDLTTLANFSLQADYKKAGFKSIRFEYQHKGGAWQLGMIFTSSPGVFQVPPQVAGVAEQIFVRAIYLENNQPVGEYSDIKTALIAP